MIDKFETLYPNFLTATDLWHNDEPYAYWLSAPEYNVYEWVLYKEYNDYESVVGNGGLKGVSYEELIESFRTYNFYEGWIGRSCAGHSDNAHWTIIHTILRILLMKNLRLKHRRICIKRKK